MLRLTSFIAVLLLLVLATSAMATHTVTYASHISIKSKGLTFSGHVTGQNHACADARHVTLYRKFSDGSHQKLGSTTTGTSGRWKITPPGSAGISLSHFYATVRKLSQGAAGTIYVCKAARSKTIPLTP